MGTVPFPQAVCGSLIGNSIYGFNGKERLWLLSVFSVNQTAIVFCARLEGGERVLSKWYVEFL